MNHSRLDTDITVHSKMLWNTIREYLPFFLIAFVIPVFTWNIPVSYNHEASRFTVTSKGYNDFFHLSKVWILYAATLILFVRFLLRWQGRLPRIFLLFIPYILLIILSVCLSDYPVTSVFGLVDHYEGALTQICYALLLIFSYSFSNEEQVQRIIKLVLWAGVAVALAGILQFTGSPLFGRMLPGEAFPTGLGWKGDLPGISSTIGNSNYTGTYAVLLIPLAFMTMIMEKNKAKKAFALLIYYGAGIFLLLGSLSRAGYISFIILCISGAVFLGKYLKKQVPWVLMAVAYAALIFLWMNSASKGLIGNELKGLNPFVKPVAEADKLVFQEIRTDNETARLQTNKWVLNIRSDEDGFSLEDELGRPVPSTIDEDDGRITLTGKPYENIHAWVQVKEGIKWILVEMEGKEIEFVHTGQDMKAVGFNSVLADVAPVKASTLIKNEAFASGRGYIWSRSLPLLKGALVWGYGPDTFAFTFPQNDFVGKLNYGSIWVIIGKPHNWYLQIALGSGLLSLLCLLIYFALYCIKTLQRHFRGFWENSGLAMGILLSVIGFFLTGVFNDSVVSVSPILWMLAGFGIRLLHDGELLSAKPG